MIFLAGLLIIAGLLSIWQAQRRKRRSVRRLLTGLAIVLLIIGVPLGVHQFWYSHRPVPASTQESIFSGVTYIRDVRQQPAAMIVYIVKIDLTNPNIHFLVTPGELSDNRQLPARTTSQFLTEFHLQVAINGDYFTPWHSYSIFDYYPHVGDFVITSGFASSQGKIYSKGSEGHPTLYISKDNMVSFSKSESDIYNAVSGNVILVQEGKSTVENLTDPYHTDRHPRTAVGLTQDGKTLLLILVDGRQPNYSEGASMIEMSSVAIQYGAYTALNLDGGGSSTLVMENSSGAPLVLNSPIDNYIPGRERPVANHLGIYASK
jgi:hypothetical protein